MLRLTLKATRLSRSRSALSRRLQGLFPVKSPAVVPGLLGDQFDCRSSAFLGLRPSATPRISSRSSSDRKKAERRIRLGRSRALADGSACARGAGGSVATAGSAFARAWRLEAAGLAGARDAELAVAVGLEMHEHLRLGQRPPPGALRLEPSETDSPQAHRSPERPAELRPPGDLVDALRRLPDVAGHGQEVQEVRHLDRLPPFSKGTVPAASAAHGATRRASAGVYPRSELQLRDLMKLTGA